MPKVIPSLGTLENEWQASQSFSHLSVVVLPQDVKGGLNKHQHPTPAKRLQDATLSSLGERSVD